MDHDIEGPSPEYPGNDLCIANISFDQLKLDLSNRFLDVPPLDFRVVEIVEVVKTDHLMAFAH
jgi:hypothetical protein